MSIEEHPVIEKAFPRYREFRNRMNKIKNSVRRKHSDEPRRVQWSQYYAEMYSEFIKMAQPVIEARDDEIDKKLKKKDKKIKELRDEIKSLQPEGLFEMEPNQ